jgi:hypothetical protein
MVTRRLRCPHCQGEFDYDFVPGMSFTAVRLGTSRYMRCPLCRRFGVFPLFGSKADGSAPVPGPQTLPTSGGEAGGTPGPLAGGSTPHFTDRRPLARWGAWLLVPAVLLILSGVLLGLPTTTTLLLATAGTVALCVGGALLIGFSLPNRVR